MKKRAKCKLCLTVVEAKNYIDIWSCSCGEISIDRISGEWHASVIKDINNLILIDDEGNEIIPKIASNNNYELNVPSTYSKESLLETLNAMAKNIDSLPQDARLAPITHSDFGALITLLSSIFRAC